MWTTILAAGLLSILPGSPHLDAASGAAPGPFRDTGSPAVVQTASPGGRLGLAWMDVAGVRDDVARLARREVEVQLAVAEVTVRWQVGEFVPGGAGQERHVRVVLLPSRPATWGIAADALGVTLLGQGAPDTVYIFVPSVVRTLGPPPVPLRLGRGLGRVVVHELVHALVPAHPHAGIGVMAGEQGHHRLVHSGVRLDAASRRLFREALLPTGR